MQNLENIYEIINKENHAATIICGDYNATTLVWENANWEGRIFRASSK